MTLYPDTLRQALYPDSPPKGDSFSDALVLALPFWREIGANKFLLSVISEGYFLPFVSLPDCLFFNNLPSAAPNKAFISQAVHKLTVSGVVSEVESHQLLLCSTLGAVPKKSTGKFRLILDLRYLNTFLHTHTFTLDVTKLIHTLFQPDDFLFTFDLQDAYYHISIARTHSPCLGFSWFLDGKRRFFHFNVLPFGLSTARYLLTMLRLLIQHWRRDGLNTPTKCSCLQLPHSI